MPSKYKIPLRRRQKKLPRNHPVMPYAENKRIKEGIAADPDTHELSRREMKQLRPYVFGKRRMKYAPAKPMHRR